MASVFTNRFKIRMLEVFCHKAYNAGALPTNLYIALITDASTPTVDFNTFTEVTDLTAGNGYTAGGEQLAYNDTDWDVLTEDDANDRAIVQLKDIVWTAAGGPLPSAGDGARFAVLTDDHVTQNSREILASWDLVAARSVTIGQTLTLQDCEVRLSTP